MIAQEFGSQRDLPKESRTRVIRATESVFDKSGPSRKSGEVRPDLREIEANSQLYLTKARANLDRFCRSCSRFRLFKHALREIPLRIKEQASAGAVYE
jgi:hypothetical protein